MRSDELMKPDFLSAAVLTVAATAVFLLLSSVAWIAILSH